MTLPSADSLSSTLWILTVSGRQFLMCCSSWSVVLLGTRRPWRFPEQTGTSRVSLTAAVRAQRSATAMFKDEGKQWCVVRDAYTAHIYPALLTHTHPPDDATACYGSVNHWDGFWQLPFKHTEHTTSDYFQQTRKIYVSKNQVKHGYQWSRSVATRLPLCWTFISAFCRCCGSVGGNWRSLNISGSSQVRGGRSGRWQMDWRSISSDVDAVPVCSGEQRPECESEAVELVADLHLHPHLQVLGSDWKNHTVTRSGTGSRAAIPPHWKEPGEAFYREEAWGRSQGTPRCLPKWWWMEIIKFIVITQLTETGSPGLTPVAGNTPRYNKGWGMWRTLMTSCCNFGSQLHLKVIKVWRLFKGELTCRSSRSRRWPPGSTCWSVWRSSRSRCFSQRRLSQPWWRRRKRWMIYLWNTWKAAVTV